MPYTVHRSEPKAAPISDIELETGNFARAFLRREGWPGQPRNHVSIDIPKENWWNKEGLSELIAALKEFQADI